LSGLEHFFDVKFAIEEATDAPLHSATQRNNKAIQKQNKTKKKSEMSNSSKS
jgi:hypothetical protein